MLKNNAPKICNECGTGVPYAARSCVGCGADVGFPNVRAADQGVETDALRERVRYAQVAAAERGCANELEEFGTAASISSAVMVRSLAALDGFLSQSNQPMISYYGLVRAGARIPEDNVWDLNRDRIDGTINPNGVHEHIQYAALSLDGLGVPWYGDYSITLRESMIAKRASVFEENPFRFCDRHPVPPTGSVPPGYRATWTRRGELALAKLHPRIRQGMTAVDFPGILLEQGSKSADSDFIEVHVYGPLHVNAVERVIGRVPAKKADQIIWKRVKRRIVELGATVEER